MCKSISLWKIVHNCIVTLVRKYWFFLKSKIGLCWYLHVLYDRCSQLIFKWKNSRRNKQSSTKKCRTTKQMYNKYTTKQTCTSKIQKNRVPEGETILNIFSNQNLGENSFIIVLHSERVIYVNIDMWPSNRDQNRFVSFKSKNYRHVTFESRTT